MNASFAAIFRGDALKANRTPVNEQDYDAAAAAYVDEDDYTVECDDLDDTEMIAAGRSLRQLSLD
jgi:hypothetical protein